MPDLDDLVSLDVLYLITIGRQSGLPREIEIWFVANDDKLYVLAEHFRNAQWVKNIERNPRVRVRLANHEFSAVARVLDRKRDQDAWLRAQELARSKYGWGDGLPVEIILNGPG